MLTGREALAQIDRAVSETQHEAQALNARVGELGEREVAMRTEMRAALEQLARFRLDQTKAGQISEAVAGIDRDVEALMQARADELAELEKRAGAITERISALEHRRVEAAAKSDAASETLDEAEAALQDSLDKDADYRARHDAAEKAQNVAAEAEHKLALAEEDRRVKGAPYEADTLFMYLWERGYGTSAYRSSSIIRMGDRWVAGLIRFEDARRNYHMLTEIPKRLKEHATRMRARADGEVDQLVALEEKARAKTEVPALEEALKEARGEVEAIDSEIAALREDTRKAEAERAMFERGEDPQFRSALDAMVDALDDQSLADLRRDALRTRMPEDDAIVARLIDLEDELDDVVHERDQLRELARGKMNKVAELEDMRVEFRRRRLDDFGSEFADARLFDLVLAEFVRGAIAGGAYWDRLERGHRRTARLSRPDFGSGKFRFPGPLSFPGSRSSHGGFGRSGGMRIGGFRTGGGMSRGGFRTGGGF